MIDSFGDSSQFYSKQLPKPQPKAGELCIRLKATGFNPVDYKTRSGMYGGQLPLILGADCSGIVEKLGFGVDTFKVGDEVYAMPFGRGSNGAYAEFCCLPVKLVAKKPSTVSFAAAAAIPLVAMTAYRATIEARTISKGDAIFIAGAGGGLGSFAVQLANHIGVKSIFTIAKTQAGAEFLVNSLGLKKDNIVIYEGLSLEALHAKILAKNAGNLFDATFDFVGRDMKQLCLELTRHSGHCSTVLTENPDFSLPVWQYGLCFNRSLSIHLVFVGAESCELSQDLLNIYQRHLAHISQLFEAGILKAPHITDLGVLSVETVQKAHELLESNRVKGKLIMRINE